MPFIIRWQGKIQQGISKALISQQDLLASLASLTGQKHQAEDSENLLNTLTGKIDTGRNGLVIEGMGKTAYREGDWMLIPAYWGPKALQPENVETGYCSCYQLYDLTKDPKQKNNLAEKYPEKLQSMLASYHHILDQ